LEDEIVAPSACDRSDDEDRLSVGDHPQASPPSILSAETLQDQLLKLMPNPLGGDSLKLKEAVPNKAAATTLARKSQAPLKNTSNLGEGRPMMGVVVEPPSLVHNSSSGDEVISYSNDDVLLSFCHPFPKALELIGKMKSLQDKLLKMHPDPAPSVLPPSTFGWHKNTKKR